MKDFNKLIKRSYKSIQDRGLITDKTTKKEFIDKIIEELDEVVFSLKYESEKRYIEELVDLVTACLMQIEHLKYNTIDEFEKVIDKNEHRAKEVIRQKLLQKE